MSLERGLQILDVDYLAEMTVNSQYSLNAVSGTARSDDLVHYCLGCHPCLNSASEASMGN